jgi:hypothetical protein
VEPTLVDALRHRAGTTAKVPATELERDRELARLKVVDMTSEHVRGWVAEPQCTLEADVKARLGVRHPQSDIVKEIARRW